MSGDRGGRSFLACWRDALRDSGLSANAKLLGHTLATYMSGGGHAFPSQQTLAAGCSLSVRTVQKVTPELEAAGLLEISRSAGRSSHGYQALLPTASELRGSAPATAKLLHPTSNKRGANSAAGAHESVERKRERFQGDVVYLDLCANCSRKVRSDELDERFLCPACDDLDRRVDIARPAGPTLAAYDEFLAHLAPGLARPDRATPEGPAIPPRAAARDGIA